MLLKRLFIAVTVTFFFASCYAMRKPCGGGMMKEKSTPLPTAPKPKPPASASTKLAACLAKKGAAIPPAIKPGAKKSAAPAAPTPAKAAPKKTVKQVAQLSNTPVAAISHDGKWLLAGRENGDAVVWNLTKTPPAAVTLHGHTKRVGVVAWSNDNYAFTGSDDATIRIWDISKSPPCLRTLDAHNKAVFMTVSPDGRYILYAAEYPTSPRAIYWVWDLVPEKRHILRSHNLPVAGAISLNNQYCFTHRGYCIESWQLSNLPPKRETEKIGGSGGGYWLGLGTGKESRSISVCSDKTIILGSTNLELRLYRLGTKKEVLFSRTFNGVNCRASMLSPNGRFVFYTTNNDAHIWDNTQDKVYDLKGHSKPVLSLAFCNKSCHALTGSEDGTARLWDLHSFPASCEVITHAGSITAVSFCNSCNHVMTVSSDKTTRLWDIK